MTADAARAASAAAAARSLSREVRVEKKCWTSALPQEGPTAGRGEVV